MRQATLVVTVILNVVLIVAVALLWQSLGRSYQMMADAMTADVEFKEQVLAALDSGDTVRINAIRETLRHNVTGSRKAAAQWQALAQSYPCCGSAAAQPSDSAAGQ